MDLSSSLPWFLKLDWCLAICPVCKWCISWIFKISRKSMRSRHNSLLLSTSITLKFNWAKMKSICETPCVDLQSSHWIWVFPWRKKTRFSLYDLAAAMTKAVFIQMSLAMPWARSVSSSSSERSNCVVDDSNNKKMPLHEMHLTFMPQASRI